MQKKKTPIRIPTATRLWKRVVRGNAADCWVWPGAKGHGGYGLIGNWSPERGTHLITTHRAAFVDAFGPIPAGSVVMHKCDNPPCLNPAHLEIGTQAKNQQDKHLRGRGPNRKGDLHPSARLTSEKALKIRHLFADGVSRRELSNQFGVSMGCISNVVYRFSWKHI